MRAAGLRIPQPSPTQRWRGDWARIMDANDHQTLLPATPAIHHSHGLNALRHAPRPDWAPPTNMTDCLQIYVMVTSDHSAWAISVIRGGDCLLDSQADHLIDAGGPVCTDATSPCYKGAHRHSARLAVRHAVSVAIEIGERESAMGDTIIVRVSNDAAPLIAGLLPEEKEEQRAARDMRKAWLECAQTRKLCLAGADSRAGNRWAQRARDLAEQCRGHVWGDPPLPWHSHGTT